VTPPVAVVDTNVLVAGLLTRDVGSPVARVLDGMLSGSFPFLVSPPLLREYREVLLRPAIVRRHGLADREVDAILTEITANARWREPSSSAQAPDRGDNHLWALLAAQPGAVLVTGDRLLLNNPPTFAAVISARSFVELLRS
jgi:putative PIN family toxin of toxin-antitoxin system